MFVENTEYEILTPSGWCDFRGLTQAESKTTHTLTLVSGEKISSTPGHYFFDNNIKVKLQELSVGDSIDTVKLQKTLKPQYMTLLKLIMRNINLS